MQFALIAYDRPGSAHRRTEMRPEHLKHLETLGEALKLAGPFLDDSGNMIGSIMVIEAESLEAARAIFARDPFMQNDLFDSVTIKPWRLTINNFG